MAQFFLHLSPPLLKFLTPQKKAVSSQFFKFKNYVGFPVIFSLLIQQECSPQCLFYCLSMLAIIEPYHTPFFPKVYFTPDFGSSPCTLQTLSGFVSVFFSVQKYPTFQLNPTFWPLGLFYMRRITFFTLYALPFEGTPPFFPAIFRVKEIISGNLTFIGDEFTPYFPNFFLWGSKALLLFLTIGPFPTTPQWGVLNRIPPQDQFLTKWDVFFPL